MPPVIFTLEPDVLTKTTKKTDNDGNSRTISERSQKDYHGKLNTLAKANLATDRASLKKAHKEVIAYIKNLYPADDEKSRHKKRFFIYAIFWAMDPDYLKKSNPYYTYLKKIPPLVNSVSGEKWVPLNKFRENPNNY